MLIAKTNSLGNNYQGLKNIATNDRNFGTQVQRTSDNNFLVSGEFIGYFICDAYSWGILIDSVGAILYDKKYAPGNNASVLVKIISINSNTYLVVGYVDRQNESQHLLI